ncbi:ribose-5-phosphate isomerase A, partial [Candidatus Bathyarchaeota archaeon]|nr:ribose-5-phosphate isomerase A [Candidatus Bathyarchaeota archaeon]
MSPLSWVEEAKRRAALEAVKEVRSGSVVGLGSGSTAAYAIQALGEALRSGVLQDVVGVPTSYQAASVALESGVPLTTLDENPRLDVAIDGADQVDVSLN